jgi:hypothetical protein
MSMKVYSDDPRCPYKTTHLTALYTRTEIDGLLAKWGIKKSGWNWEPEANLIYIEFQYEEEIEGVRVSPVIRVEAPVIWDHRTRKNAEAVNWNISLRVMWWFIKTHLEASFLWQSHKTVAFLPHIVTGKQPDQILARKILLNLEKIQNMPALESYHPAAQEGS